MRARRGVTLTETMVAGAMLALVTLALFEGVSVAARISRENAEVLQAEGIAWDAVWTAFNEDYDSLLGACTGAPTRTVVLPSAAAPLLARYANAGYPKLTLTLSRSRVTTDSDSGRSELFVCIAADVEWGAPGRVKRLSKCMPRAAGAAEGTPTVFVWRSPMRRVEGAR